MIGVVDTIRSIKPQVQTVALGAVYSYSSLILVRAGHRAGDTGVCVVRGDRGG